MDDMEVQSAAEPVRGTDSVAARGRHIYGAVKDV